MVLAMKHTFRIAFLIFENDMLYLTKRIVSKNFLLQLHQNDFRGTLASRSNWQSSATAWILRDISGLSTYLKLDPVASGKGVLVKQFTAELFFNWMVHIHFSFHQSKDWDLNCKQTAPSWPKQTNYFFVLWLSKSSVIQPVEMITYKKSFHINFKVASIEIIYKPLLGYFYTNDFAATKKLQTESA